MQRSTNLSIFVISSHEKALFERCITSVLSALPPKSEIVVVLNGEQSDKQAWLRSFGDDRIVVVESERTCVSNLRNRAFIECSGEIIHFIDDDVIAPPFLFKDVLEEFEGDSELAILGGPNLTPPNSSFVERLGGAVLTSPFAAPYVYRRYVKGNNRFPGSQLSFILCNLAIRKRACLGSLDFYPNLYPNEENLLLHRASSLGLKTRFQDSLYVYHHRRSTVQGILKQVAGYGFGRCHQTMIEPRSFPIPFLMLGILTGLAVLALGLSFNLAAIYTLGAFIGWLSSAECRRTGIIGFFISPALTLAVQLSYAVGFIKGISFRAIPQATAADPMGEGCYGS